MSIVYDVFSWGSNISDGNKNIPGTQKFRGCFISKKKAIAHAKKYKFAVVNKHRRVNEVTQVFKWKRPT